MRLRFGAFLAGECALIALFLTVLRESGPHDHSYFIRLVALEFGAINLALATEYCDARNGLS